MTLHAAPLLLLLAAAPLAAVELPSVTYLGRVTNWAGMEASLANPNARIQVFRSDTDVLLAATTIGIIGDSRYNYTVHIPMTLTPDADYGQQGLSICFKAEVDNTVYTSPRFTLPEAGTLVKYDIAFATDENGNGVADEYETELEAFEMPENGISGSYDADADYDGDGISNRDEYYAGTDPFWAEDRLAVTAFNPKAEADHIEVEFIASSGRNYLIEKTVTLSETFAEEPFRLEAKDGAKAYERLNAETDRTAKVYLLPSDANSAFIRVAVDIVPVTKPETP